MLKEDKVMDPTTEETVETPVEVVDGEELIRIEGLKEYFDISAGAFRRSRKLKAVDDVWLTIKKGETLGVVGESGCGKTTLGRTLMYLYKPTGGKIFYKGQLHDDLES